MGRCLVSRNEQRVSAKLSRRDQRRAFYPAKRSRSSDRARSVSFGQSRLRNRVRTKSPSRLGGHPDPRDQTYFEVQLIAARHEAESALGDAIANTRDAGATRSSKSCYDAPIMTSQVLSEKVGVVFGVANKRSIAWAIAKAWAAAGARLIFNYQGER